MRFLFFFILLLSCLGLSSNNSTQENATAPSRTPEQEAALQTQKMQQELNLSQEQSQAIYDINLKHARERQVSNSRSQSLERVRNKDTEVREVLSRDQYNRLQDKRYERYPSGGTQVNRPETQQRTKPVPQRTIPTEQRRVDPNQQRTVTPSDDRRVQTVPQRTIPSPEQRVVVPRQTSPSDRINIERRTTPATPQARPTPSQDQNRSTRSAPPPPSNNSSGNDRPARR